MSQTNCSLPWAEVPKFWHLRRSEPGWRGVRRGGTGSDRGQPDERADGWRRHRDSDGQWLHRHDRSEFRTVAASNLAVVSDTQLTVTSPSVAAAGAVHVTVTTPAGTSATTPADQRCWGRSGGVRPREPIGKHRAGKDQHERQASGWTRPAIAGLVLP
jgi:hypothetical protein